ncbi:hypothetical protein SLEP1_g42237 [Rubroshorea leprosula]|uniref:Uncharacterized protein n=1 Tax=Rubroshorea leprosula TaxID=152421 RepID=A0AAV5LAJ0_9ROSI|nr:hypothetical protein SLEP1_g42237 [Rubroshorea leprosula]
MMDSDHDKCWPKKQNSSGRNFGSMAPLGYKKSYTLYFYDRH